MKNKTLLLLGILLLCVGCHSVSNIHVNLVSDIFGRESFLVPTYKDSLGEWDNKLLEIDSTGKISVLSNLTTNQRNCGFFLLNDSTYCCGSCSSDINNLKIINIHTGKEITELSNFSISAISKNKQSIVVRSPPHRHQTIQLVYEYFDNKLIPTGDTIQDFTALYIVGDSQFAYIDDVKTTGGYLTICPNGKSYYSSSLYYRSYDIVSDSNAIKLIYASGEIFPPSVVTLFNLFSNRIDTVFRSQSYLSNARRIANTEYYLLQGMTQREYYSEMKMMAKIMDEDAKTHSCSLFTPVVGYQLIGDVRSGKIKKLLNEDKSFVLSSSGRHILFYKLGGLISDIEVLSTAKAFEESDDMPQ